MFALNPIYINIDLLDPTGTLKAELAQQRAKLNGPSMDFAETIGVKLGLLRKLFKPETQKHFMQSEGTLTRRYGPGTHRRFSPYRV